MDVLVGYCVCFVFCWLLLVLIDSLDFNFDLCFMIWLCFDFEIIGFGDWLLLLLLYVLCWLLGYLIDLDLCGCGFDFVCLGC